MTELATRRQTLMPSGTMREACPWHLVTPLRHSNQSSPSVIPAHAGIQAWGGPGACVDQGTGLDPERRQS